MLTIILTGGVETQSLKTTALIQKLNRFFDYSFFVLTLNLNPKKATCND